MFSYRLFESGGDVLLAICDLELLGKTFEEADLSLTVDPGFYSGKECREAESIALSRKSTIINAVGNRIVNLLVDEKIVDRSGVIEIGGVLHAQVVSVY
jgi:hypothetical protein